ncbi:MAG: Gfo/Idh/MocA family oxidoreductase [bacterium]|nr:Gfo/Idh/MocA family oxidoreductase [bacterium]
MVKVAVVGLGYWGPNLLRSFNQLPDANVVAICDAEEKQLKKFASLYPQVRTTTRYEEILNDPQIEAVILSVPAPLHYQLGRQALLADKNVFIEKPLALNLSEAEELVVLAAKKQKVLMVGHLMKYHPAVTKLKEYIDNKDIGEVLYMYATRVNLGKIRFQENALWSLAVHDIAIILYLLGNTLPQEVSAQGASYLTDKVEDVVFVNLLFPHKVLATVHASWLDPHKIRQLTIVGSKKMAVFNDMEGPEKIRLYDKGVDHAPMFQTYSEYLTIRDGDIHIPTIQMKEPLQIECNHFLKCIIDKKVPLSDGADGVRVLKVLEAAQESMRHHGKQITVK